MIFSNSLFPNKAFFAGLQVGHQHINYMGGHNKTKNSFMWILDKPGIISLSLTNSKNTLVWSLWLSSPHDSKLKHNELHIYYIITPPFLRWYLQLFKWYLPVDVLFIITKVNIVFSTINLFLPGFLMLKGYFLLSYPSGQMHSVQTSFIPLTLLMYKFFSSPWLLIQNIFLMWSSHSPFLHTLSTATAPAISTIDSLTDANLREQKHHKFRSSSNYYTKMCVMFSLFIYPTSRCS